MQTSFTLTFNFKGGVISPGELLNILAVLKKAGISNVSFGLRQQLLAEVSAEDFADLRLQLKQQQIDYATNTALQPNIASSYPAAGIFTSKTWLSEGIYKDIFDSFDYKPSLKINICDSYQSFTPLLTGNINWIASAHLHYWHLVIRFPKTNVIYYWREIFYTNDIAAFSKLIEQTIIRCSADFIANPKADGELLYCMLIKHQNYITRLPEKPLELSPFTLPYYEGFNKYHDKYWLGIYRRNEQFSIKFLQDLCMICLATKIGQFCSTSWKSLIIKGIEEKDRNLWNELLNKHQVNVRHAANELNFQVEDHCEEGLRLKTFLVKHLSNDDARTYGICFGIKTRKNSEIFSNILIRKKSLFTIAGVGFFNLFDILIAKDFNPNERTGTIFSKNNLRLFLPEQLRQAIVSHHIYKQKDNQSLKTVIDKPVASKAKEVPHYVYQCKSCYSIYDEKFGDAINDIEPGTRFTALPDNYYCPTCDEPKSNFTQVDAKKLCV